jgi:HEPN domain-containing protein
MSPLDPKSQETREWLVIAKLDLGAAKKLAVDSEFSTQSVFHAQQCAEKAFKAFLIWNQERFRKDHDLGYLGSLAIRQDSTLKELVDEAIILNPYAVTTRYPGFTDDIEAVWHGRRAEIPGVLERERADIRVAIEQSLGEDRS